MKLKTPSNAGIGRGTQEMMRNLQLATILILLFTGPTIHAQNVDGFESAQLIREDEGPVAISMQERTHILIPLAKVHLPEIDFSDILEPSYLETGPSTTAFRISGQCSAPDTTATVHLRDRDGWPNPDDRLDTTEADCNAENGQFTAEFVIWCTPSLGLTGDVNQVRGLEGNSGEEAPEVYVTTPGETQRAPSTAGANRYWVFHCSDSYRVIQR